MSPKSVESVSCPDVLTRLSALTFQPRIKFEALILVDLMTMNKDAMDKPGDMLVNGAINRRDIWPSRDEAYKLLKARPAWRVWDDRVLRIYVVCEICAIVQQSTGVLSQEKGMRPLPTVIYPEGEGVTLKCPRIQETVCPPLSGLLTDFSHLNRPATEILSALLGLICTWKPSRNGSLYT